MQEIVVIDGEITLENVLDGEVELEAITDLDPEVVLSTGGAVYPHYSGSYEVTPSSSVQTLQTTDMVMDDDVTVQAVPQGSATTPATIITADPTISVSSGGLITAQVSKTQQITPTVVEGYVETGTAGNVGVSGSNTEQLSVQGAQTIHPASTDQSIASGKYLTGAQTFKAVTVSGLTADKVLQGNVVKIGDADDDDRIMSVTGTASGGITPTGTKSITANGTSIDVYNYQYADVAVPNSYSASDEGKVVNNGSLVGQTAQTITHNGTYDTTLIDELTVNVPTGGGGYTLEEIATKAEPSGAIVYAGSSLAKFAFAGSPITSFVGANVTSTGFCCFGACPNLTSISLPSLTNFSGLNINNDNFKLDALTALHIPNVQTIGSQVFTQMPSLTSLVLPKLRSTSINGFNTAGSGIVTVDIGEDLSSIGGYAFNGSANILVNVILRKSDDIVALPSAGNLPNREINYYVPSDLISTYQTATNWSTKYASGYAVFHAIEGSQYENYYADGTPISS